MLQQYMLANMHRLQLTRFQHVSTCGLRRIHTVVENCARPDLWEPCLCSREGFTQRDLFLYLGMARNQPKRRYQEVSSVSIFFDRTRQAIFEAKESLNYAIHKQDVRHRSIEFVQILRVPRLLMR